MKRKATDTTFKSIQEILPNVLQDIEKSVSNPIETFRENWKLIVGEKVARFSRIEAFEDNKLKVVVLHPALLNLLSYQEKTKILRMLRQKFPDIQIVDILFRIGV